MNECGEPVSADRVRVAVVEDDPGLRALYQSIVAYDKNVEVTACSTINDARQVDWSVIDIAIVDLGLPDGSGTQVMQMLKRDHPNVRRIIATGLPLSALDGGDLYGAEIAVTKGDAWECVVRGLILDLTGRRPAQSEPNEDKEKESWISRMLR